jgi:hypothetical protein
MAHPAHLLDHTDGSVGESSGVVRKKSIGSGSNELSQDAAAPDEDENLVAPPTSVRTLKN